MQFYKGLLGAAAVELPVVNRSIMKMGMSFLNNRKKIYVLKLLINPLELMVIIPFSLKEPGILSKRKL